MKSGTSVRPSCLSAPLVCDTAGAAAVTVMRPSASSGSATAIVSPPSCPIAATASRASGRRATERLADSRVDVEHLVLTVARIETVPDVEDAVVPHRLHEPGGRAGDLFDPAALAKRCAADVHGKLPNLVSREAEQAIGLAIEIA